MLTFIFYCSIMSDNTVFYLELGSSLLELHFDVEQCAEKKLSTKTSYKRESQLLNRLLSMINLS